MGATVTTFCNATNIILYTSLSVWVPYYSTDQLQPGQCVSYTTGQVWFTATAQIHTDTNVGNLYFPVSENRAVGLLHGWPYVASDVHFVDMTPNEAEQVMESPADVIDSDYKSVSRTYMNNQQKLLAQIVGFYTNKNKKITITGGPKGAVYKEHPYLPGKHIAIVSAHSELLKMTVS